MVKCVACGNQWDLFQSPYCPKCLATQWELCPNLIAPKHDPGMLPSGAPFFRSIVTEDVVTRKSDFLEYTATSGNWYYSTQHQKYCVFCPDPLGVIPGSGIPRGSTVPTFAMDGLVVADATKDAHLYTEDQTKFRSGIRSGLYQPLGHCSEPGCSYLVVPGETKCALHRPNPYALP